MQCSHVTLPTAGGNDILLQLYNLIRDTEGPLSAMLPRASGRYFNHASVKRNSLPDQASSRSAWFFFLGQVNCQFKHLLSQIGWKRSGRRGRSLLWPRLQCDLSGYWSRREQETHGCDRISGPPTANPVIRMQWWLTQLRIPWQLNPLRNPL